MKNKFILLMALALAQLTGVAQGKWELRKNENGIAVYTRKAATGNLKELRVLCELDATKADLINTILNISDYNSWVYSNKKSVVLKTESPQKIIYYTQTNLPWPIKDRDLVVELTIDPSSDPLNIQVKSIPDFMPDNKDYVRVPYSLALWKVTQIADSKLKVDYTFSVDPGGSIPSWLVNATLTIGPYNSFVKLKQKLRDRHIAKP